MNTGKIVKYTEGMNWDSIIPFSINRIYWSEPTEICAEARICYDEDAIYVRLTAQEREIRAEEKGPSGMPCEDSCLEFFLAPDPEDSRYLNFEFNPNACMYLGIATGIQDLIRLLPENAKLFQPCVEMMETGWSITYQIPNYFIRFFFPKFEAVSGRKVRANFYKCGDKTRIPHFLSWNELTSPAPDFHRSCDFGELFFE